MLRVADLGLTPLEDLLRPYGLHPILVAEHSAIPGSYWGESEAGLQGDRLYLRADTPVHSALHEAAHFICMDEARRRALDRDAGGDYAEEDAVCYLQLVLAAQLPTVGSGRLCADMDAWGYTFRLGSAASWFAEDADDARRWLLRHGLIDGNGEPQGRCRSQ